MGLSVNTVEADGGQVGLWQPPTINMGDASSSGVSVYLNDSGAGKYYSFPSVADSKLCFSESLNEGIPYDGSAMAIRLRWRISTGGGSGKTVGWVLTYAILKDGDNSATLVTNVAQQDVLLDGIAQDIMFTTTLANMSGVVGGHTLLFTIERNGSGVGSDNFNGNAEVLGIELIKP